MNYNPNRYTGSPKKKLLFRCLIVLASLAVVCAMTLAYGNYLKQKAKDTLGGDYSGAGRSVSADGVGSENEAPTSFSKSVSVKSPAIDISAFAEVDALNEQIDKMAQSGATGITVVLLDRDGYLTYASDAVAKHTHQHPAQSVSQGILTTLTQKARSLSMRTSAVIYTSEDFAQDGLSSDIETLVCADAAACGFDEVVAIMPVNSTEINSDSSASILKYIGRLASARSGALLGVAFGDDVFRTPSLSPQIELFASGANFLAIDLGYRFDGADSAKAKIEGTVDELTGSFTVYGLRAVFEGGDSVIDKATVEALADCGFSNYMFTKAVPAEDSPETDEVTEGGDVPYYPQDDPEPQWGTDSTSDDTQSADTEGPQTDAVTDYPQDTESTLS